MATAGEGAEGAKASAYEGGGVGGKFRKRPFRRSQITPYDRPTAAAASRNPTWLSKLVVDPASKLIGAGAQRFFSSLFRKRLPPPPLSQPPEDRQESINGLPETVPDNQAGPQEPAGNEDRNPSFNGISELEKSLKHKALTRSEIERLTQLLHSRAVDLPVKDDNTKIEANFSIQNTKSMSGSARHEQFSIPLEGSEIKRDRAHGDILTPTVGKMVLEDETASPAELAKAYMGSKSSKLSPSKLGLRSQIASEEAILINTSPFTSRSAITSLAMKTTGHVGRLENGFTDPRSSGISALYNTRHTPYSRIRSTSIQKVSRSTSYGYTRPPPLSSQPAWDNDRQFRSRPTALKRRNSLLDDDIGSVGPIRRIRQKTNPLSHGLSLSARRVGLGSEATQLQKLPLMDEMKNNPSNTPIYAHVPPKSSEMAARILEHLERMTPKKKSPESKLAVARERSPVKLTPDFQCGQALGSLENLDASKSLQNAQGDNKLGCEPIGSSPESHDSVAQKQSKVEENVSVKFVSPFGESTPVVNTNATVPTKGFTPNTGSADAAQPSERNRSFKISAHEDSLELDNGGHSSEPASKFFDKEEGRSHPLPVPSNGAELEERHTGFAFSWAHVSNISSQKTSGKVPFSVDSSAKNLIRGSVSAGETDASVKVLESDKSGNKSFQQDASSVNGISTAPASTTLADLNFSNNANHLVSSSSATTISTSKSGASNSAIFITNMAPSISSSSVFNVGSSVIPSTAASETSFFSLAASSDSPDSLTGSRSAVGTKLSSPGSGISPVSQSMSVQFGSSSSPVVFGSSASQSFTSSSIFGSFFPATTLSVLGSSSSGTSSATTETGFISSSRAKRRIESNGVTVPSSVTPAIVSFGVSSVLSTAEPNAVTSGSVAAPVTLSFGVKSATSPSESNAVTSGSGAIPATFAFGAKSAPSSSSLGAPVVFSFGASSASSAATSGSSTTPSMFSFGASSASSSATSSSSTTPSMFSFAAGSPVSSAANGFTSSGTTVPSIFSFGANASSSSSGANSVSASGGNSSFTPAFGSSFNASSSSGFSFGASSSSFGSSNSAPTTSGLATFASSSQIFPFASASATTLSSLSSGMQTAFGTPTPFAVSPGNNDQMNTEDSMAEDPVQSSTSAAPVFGQSPVSPSPQGFMFGSTVPSPAVPFQFGGQQNQAAPQDTSQFQASSSLGFGASGSFSLGSSGPDKSGRKIVKVSRNRNRKR